MAVEMDWSNLCVAYGFGLCSWYLENCKLDIVVISPAKRSGLGIHSNLHSIFSVSG